MCIIYVVTRLLSILFYIIIITIQCRNVSEVITVVLSTMLAFSQKLFALKLKRDCSK